MSSLAFFAADTLGMTLYQVGDHLESSEIRPIRMGPWQVDMPIKVVSDVITPRSLSFWVTLGALRLYLIIRDKESTLMAFDEAALKKCGEATSFAATTIKGRIQEVEPAIKQAFHWVEDQKRWLKMDNQYLIEEIDCR